MDETRGTQALNHPKSARRPTLPAASEFRRRVRDVLAHLNDTAYLQTHPLAGISALASGHSNCGSATAVRQAVTEAIRSLRPDARAPAGSSAWRRYRILELRYEEGGDARTIQATLAIGQAEYYREHREAIQAVVAVLWERFAASETGPAAMPTAPPGAGLEYLRLRDLPRLRPRSPLPVPLTDLIGREPDMAAAKKALASGRLVTLTGPPGTGKTRLALELAAGADEQFADGVYFVNLAPIPDPELVIPAIAWAIAFEPDAGRADDERSLHERLVAELQTARALLVLDNFEQVVEAGPALADLLQQCPQVTALATSRVPLQVRGEREMPVPPLGLPAAIRAIDASRAAESAAVRLFVERARAVRAGFQLTDGNAPAVAELCVRLDGLPLALELAAARSDVLSPEGILRRLDAQSLLFDQGPRDLPPRQRTLHAAIAWSYDLLGKEEQALFRRLAVFSGSWSLASAAAVVGGSNLLDGLSTLVRSSLVQRRAPAVARGVESLDGLSALIRSGLGRPAVAVDGEGRFAMLETVRAYGLRQLAAAGEREGLHRRHAEYFSSLVECAEWARTRPLVRSPDYGTDAARPAREHLLHEVEAEESNLRAALGWAVEHGEGPQALWLAAGLAALGFYRGHSVDERSPLEAALGLPGAQSPTPARAVALNVLGELAGVQGDDARSRALLEEELKVEAELADERATGFTLIALRRLAIREGRHAEARALNEQALRIFQGMGDALGLAGALTGLGQEAMIHSELPRARAYLTEALAIGRYLPALRFLGLVALDEGKLAEARQCLQGFLQLSQTRYDGRLLSGALEAFAGLAAAEAQAERAFRLAGAAAGLRAVTNLPLPAWQRRRHERWLALAVAALDEPAREAAWAEGQAMAVEQAIHYALGTD